MVSLNLCIIGAHNLRPLLSTETNTDSPSIESSNEETLYRSIKNTEKFAHIKNSLKILCKFLSIWSGADELKKSNPLQVPAHLLQDLSCLCLDPLLWLGQTGHHDAHQLMIRRGSWNSQYLIGIDKNVQFPAYIFDFHKPWPW